MKKILVTFFLIQAIWAIELEYHPRYINPLWLSQPTHPAHHCYLKYLEQVSEFETEYLCDDKNCTQGFKSERESYYHYSTYHSNKKQFFCLENNCFKPFTTKHLLISHIRLNHPDTPFKCNHCLSKIYFTNFAELKTHLQAFHMNK